MLKKIALVTTIIMLTFAQNVFANEVSENEVKAIIVKHSIELGIDPALGLSIAKTESKFRHSARSVHGAVGVFQLLPSTAKTMGINPYYLSDNIRGGLMYYKKMYQMFGSTEMALAAYNAGPVAVKKQNTIPGYTKGFVNTIMKDYQYYKKNPDPAMLKVIRKAPAFDVKLKPVVKEKPSITTSPIRKGKTAGLSTHSLKMIDISAEKSVKDSLI